MKKLLVLVLVAFGCAGFIYLRSGGETPTVFRTAAVERGELIVAISATGTVEPEEVIDVGAQVAGQILSFGKDTNGKPVDYGSSIEEGTVLANIDDALYTSEVAQADAQVLSAKGGLQRAEADLGQMKSKLVLAENNWQRAKQIETRALAAIDYDNYKVGYETAKADVLIGEAAIVQAKGALAQAEGMLQRAKRNLSYTTIASPVKGVIIDRRVNIGQTVVASLNAPSLFLIAKDLTRIQVWVAVNEADIGRLHTGQPVTFSVDAFPGESFKGQVGKIRLNASMTQNVVTYTVEVVADNPGGRLLPYLTANVKFELSRRENVLMVPNAALRWVPDVERVVPQFRKGFDDASATPQDAVATGESPGNAVTSQPASSPRDEPSVGIVWVVEGQLVRPIRVWVGLTDDVMTEVRGDGLSDGLSVVTGEDEQAEVEAETVGSNPFLPKMPRAAPPVVDRRHRCEIPQPASRGL